MTTRIVAKVGGSLIRDGIPQDLVRDLAEASRANEVVLVHGGGDAVTSMARKLGKEQRFITSPDGFRSRYTDKETSEIYQMVMTGVLSKRLVLALSGEGAKAVSVSGTDAGTLRARRKARLVVIDDRGRKVAVDGGYTGKVSSVDPVLLESLLRGKFVPVVSPVAEGDGHEPLNIDGDRAAASLASALGADLVVFFTDVDGLTLNGSLVTDMTAEEARRRLKEVGFGMQKKVMSAVEAVESGVGEAVICSGAGTGPLERAMKHDTCTVVRAR
jgi:[amino group carrier protein]-L-2-aminoadipate/L-glutamate 6-kinase